MAKKVEKDKEKSLEDKIWDSANKLRGNLTASEYQNGLTLALLVVGSSSASKP